MTHATEPPISTTRVARNRAAVLRARRLATAALCALAVGTALGPTDAAAQRNTSQKTTPLEEAAARKRAGQSAATVAAALEKTYRLDSPEVARTLLDVRYAAREVGRAVARDIAASPERAYAGFERAKIDPVAAFTMMVQAVEGSLALRILRDRLGSKEAVIVFGRSEVPASATPEEVAEDMDAAGFSAQEIIDVLLSDPWSLDADAILALFLELNIQDPGNNPELHTYLRDKGLEAEAALGALVDWGMSHADAASLLAAAGYGWDRIADGLVGIGRTVKQAIHAVRDAGAPLTRVVRWAWNTGTRAPEVIIEELTEIGEDPLDVAKALYEAGLSATEVAAALRAAGHGLDKVTEFLAGQGLSPAEVAEILYKRLGVSGAHIATLLKDIMGATHDGAMAIISNLGSGA